MFLELVPLRGEKKVSSHAHKEDIGRGSFRKFLMSTPRLFTWDSHGQQTVGVNWYKEECQQNKIRFSTNLSSRTDIISPDLNVSSLSSTASKSYNARTFLASA